MKRTILCGLFLIASSAFANQSPRYTESYDKCIDVAEGATFKMIDCTSDETKYQEKRLNESYKKLMNGSQLSQQKKIELRNFQRKWIKRRLQAVSEEASPDGGQAALMNAASLYLSITTKRADELEKMVTNN